MCWYDDFFARVATNGVVVVGVVAAIVNYSKQLPIAIFYMVELQATNQKGNYQ